jgi:hypothetical protein
VRGERRGRDRHGRGFLPRRFPNVAALATFRAFEYGVGIACSLEGLAALAALERRDEDAAIMLGAADALFESAGASREPGERALHERTTAALGARLEPARSASLAARGRSMALDDVFASAVGLGGPRHTAVGGGGG